jgi:hypothetical protein
VRGVTAPLSDPALPGLARALDGGPMAAEFEGFFQREYPSQSVAVRGCEVEGIRHKPGKRCRITYRLSGSDVAGPFERRLTCRLLAADRSPDRYLEGVPDSVPACSPWRPVLWWPEMRMVIHVFPFDPALPELARLLDPEAVRDEVDRRLESWGWSRPWSAAQVAPHVIKYRRGRRCLIRYEVALDGPGGATERLAFFGKTYRSSRSDYIYQALAAIYANIDGLERSFEIPRPLAHLDAANTVWQEEWPGEGPRERAARLGWARCLDRTTLESVARLIAAIHQTELPSGLLEPGSTGAFLLENARADVENIRAFVPEPAAQLERVLELLERCVPAAPPREVPLHGTFKLAQILCRDDCVAVVDFDSVAVGDPLLDVGEFAASLVHLETRDGVEGGLVDAAVARLLAAYAAAVPWPCERTRLAWYTTVFLLGKTHSLFKKHDATGVRNAAVELRRLEAWAREAAGERG